MEMDMEIIGSDATQVDYFPNDFMQWNDTDGDGFGDNPGGALRRIPKRCI